MLEMFLIMNNYDIDVTQRKIEMYYQVRTDYPEIFRNKNPTLPHMMKVADVIYTITLPELTPEMYRVNILKIKDTNPSNLDAYDFVAHMLNCLELNYAKGNYAAGELFIYDLEGISLRHMFKFGLGLIRKLARVLQEVYSPKTKGIHFINCPIFIDTILTIARAATKEKIAKRFKVHNSKETLKEFIPESILPIDYGGQEECLDTLRKAI
ncbi:hypothetical protein WA026_023192 [Henosepilachna vigintioctopunctata]|uniref:CRAL-TRIO domain-containing protein n=1 Tax=Henosepilachna vigintioctopunctata TaxID=420089 RepID=A0AAW1US53_9CUCU